MKRYEDEKQRYVYQTAMAKRCNAHDCLTLTALPIEQVQIKHAGILFDVLTAGEGYPLIMLHGGASPARHFIELIEILEEHFHLIAYDQRGFSKSPMSAEVNIDHLGWAHDVTGIMDAMGLDKAVVLGWSMGASIAINAAAWSEDRITALILLGAPDPAKSVDVARLQANHEKMDLLSEAQLRDHYRQEFSQQVAPYLADDDALLERLAADRMSIDPKYSGQIIEAIGTRPDLRISANAVKCPVHLIVGAEDKICPPESARRMASYLSHATIDLVEQCGHYYAAEQPQDVGRLIITRLTNDGLKKDAF